MGPPQGSVEGKENLPRPLLATLLLIHPRMPLTACQEQRASPGAGEAIHAGSVPPPSPARSHPSSAHPGSAACLGHHCVSPGFARAEPGRGSEPGSGLCLRAGAEAAPSNRRTKPAGRGAGLATARLRGGEAAEGSGVPAPGAQTWSLLQPPHVSPRQGRGGGCVKLGCHQHLCFLLWLLAFLSSTASALARAVGTWATSSFMQRVLQRVLQHPRLCYSSFGWMKCVNSFTGLQSMKTSITLTPFSKWRSRKPLAARHTSHTSTLYKVTVYNMSWQISYNITNN